MSLQVDLHTLLLLCNFILYICCCKLKLIHRFCLLPESSYSFTSQKSGQIKINMETSVPTSTIDFINSVIPSHLTSLTASDLGFKEETEEDQYQRELQRQMMEGETCTCCCMLDA